MYVNAIVLSALLLGGGALGSADPPAVPSTDRHGLLHDMTQAITGKTGDSFIQLAAGNKGGDKYLSGKAGGRYGIGGTKGSKKSGK